MKHRQWTTENWKKVLWTNESKSEIFSSSCRVVVRRRVGERMVPQCVTPTAKHGRGSVMICSFCWIQSRRLAQSDWHPEPKGLPQHFAAPCNILWFMPSWSGVHPAARSRPKTYLQAMSELPWNKRTRQSASIMEWPAVSRLKPHRAGLG